MDSLTSAVQLGALWERQQSAIRSWGKRRVAALRDASISVDDFLQEVFLRMRSRFESFDPEATPERVWVYGQARDAYVDLFRRIHQACRDPARACHLESWVDNGMESRLAESLTGILSKLARHDAARQVASILDELSNPGDREVITMRDLDGLSFEEIGTLIGTSCNNARLKHFRAIQRLRTLWRKKYPSAEFASDSSMDGDREHLQ